MGGEAAEAGSSRAGAFVGGGFGGGVEVEAGKTLLISRAVGIAGVSVGVGVAIGVGIAVAVGPLHVRHDCSQLLLRLDGSSVYMLSRGVSRRYVVACS